MMLLRCFSKTLQCNTGVLQRALFSKKKGHSLSVAPEPLAIWDKNLEDLEFGLLEELKTWSVVAPEHTSGSFYLERTRIQGLGVLLSDRVVWV